MSDETIETSESNESQLLTFIGSLGALLIFLLILFVAYLPNRPEPVDEAIVEKRLNTLRESRAAGRSKLNSYKVINKEQGIVQVPIEIAKELTLRQFEVEASKITAE
jgi:hypothetical protein